MKKDSRQTLVIFTDGACSGNPGPGGWGSILAYPDGRVVELGGKARDATNNQMELLAVVKSLDAASDFEGTVAVYTDSTYLIRGITQWIWGWKKKGWKTAEGKDVANQDLWKILLRLSAGRKPKIEWHYVRGHIGTPGNERVDEIATKYCSGKYVALFHGSLLQYDVAIHDLPEDTSLPEMRPQEEKKAAHSYLSLVNDVLERHTDWKSCEARVKGRPGAKFKKAMAAEDERKIIQEWGIEDPKKSSY